MPTITFDLDEFKEFLRRISPSGGDDGLYGVCDKHYDIRTYMWDWKNGFEDGEVYFAYYGHRTSQSIIGKIKP